MDELKKRFLYIQALETARCYEESVLTAPEDADVGAILGWGFAPWSGGPLSLIDTVGLKAFVAECDRLAQAYGPRFAPDGRAQAHGREGRDVLRAAACEQGGLRNKPPRSWHVALSAKLLGSIHTRVALRLRSEGKRVSTRC